MRSRISLAIGLTLTAIAIGLVLSRSPVVVARSNAVPIEGLIGSVSTASEACQAHEVLPQSTTAIRLSMEALYGPRVSLRVVRGGELLTSGERGSGWTWQSVTIPVRAVRRTFSNVSICFALVPRHEVVSLNGGPSARAPISLSGARSSEPIGIRIEYLRPGSRSWWSLAGSVAERMGFGRATSGTWIAFVVLVAMLALTAGVSWLAVRETR